MYWEVFFFSAAEYSFFFFKFAFPGFLPVSSLREPLVEVSWSQTSAPLLFSLLPVLSLAQGRPQTEWSFQLISVIFCDRSIEEASGSL